jgi:hypothetical protein
MNVPRRTLLTHRRCPPEILCETLPSEPAITTTVSTMVVSETHALDPVRGLTLLRVIRRGLWLGECLGVTDYRADVLG